jgi:hypothetical protein
MGRRAICAGTLFLGVVEEAARSAERLDGADRLDCGSSRVVELPLRPAFFRKISGMEYFVSDLLC